jgi:hypothetical protein
MVSTSFLTQSLTSPPFLGWSQQHCCRFKTEVHERFSWMVSTSCCINTSSHSFLDGLNILVHNTSSHPFLDGLNNTVVGSKQKYTRDWMVSTSSLTQSRFLDGLNILLYNTSSHSFLDGLNILVHNTSSHPFLDGLNNEI